MSENCGNCRYYRRLQPLQPMGVCRRKPPLQILVGQLLNKITNEPMPRVDTFWPMIPDIEWCGEHEPATGRVDVSKIDLSKLDQAEIEGQA